jgi:transposase-like protein
MTTRTDNNSDARMTRGLELSKTATIAENEDGSFTVPSQTSNLSYEVKTLGGVWVCTCPDFENRADQIEACKHIHATRFWIAAKVELKQAPKPKVFADDATQCSCGSIKVVKFGHANGKQIFKCRDCGRKFREGLIKKARYSPETITLTLDLYFSGLSLRKITRMVNDHFDMNLGKSSVYRWIETFVPKISEYVNSLAPTLSETWQADELFVKMKNGVKDTQYNQKSMAYLWNVMDRKTRFLLASRISTHRNVNGAVGAFNAARKVAHDSQPEKIFADGLNAYPQAMTYWESESGKPELVARMGVGKPHANNNRIERLNGTLRERVKVQRGWKSVKTPLAEGQRIQYNFVKPHMALEGQTPAQAAEIGLTSKNKWMELLKKSLSA